jgi:hypothetical protein
MELFVLWLRSFRNFELTVDQVMGGINAMAQYQQYFGLSGAGVGTS